jgi:two-component system phosphate regulon sensor histidine kinase PhoR
MRPSIFGRTIVYTAVAVAAASLVFLFAALYASDAILLNANSVELSKTAALASAFLGEAQPSQELADKIHEITGYRVTLVDRGGKVLAETSSLATAIGDHGDRPEIRGAFLAGRSTASRTSATTGERTLYAATLVGGTAGSYVIRLALPLPRFASRLGDSSLFFALFLGIVALLSLGASYALKRYIASPLSQLAKKAESYLEKFPEKSSDSWTLPAELALVDQALDTLVRSVQEKKQESEALSAKFSSIIEAAGEGVIAVDQTLTIVEANSASARLFSRTVKDLLGKPIAQATSSREAEKIFLRCMEDNAEVSKTIMLFRDGPRKIHVHATPFSWAGGSGKGAVAVFGDITELSRLEKVRKEFVANVSHELRTPIQIIHGYAEILSGLPVGDDAAHRYLGLIEANAKRMERILADLLSLARLEDEEASRVLMEPGALIHALKAALDAAAPFAERKRISFALECPEHLYCSMNSGLMEQAVFNLLDNAITYSPEGSLVSVRAWEGPDEWITLEVADQGIGIPASDLSRIFERFYRVDKSRSKETGGTGLGLAIVKHIVQIHGGEVSASSFLNEGSTFRIMIPQLREVKAERPE